MPCTMHPVRVKNVPKLGSTCTCVKRLHRKHYLHYWTLLNYQKTTNSQPKYSWCFRRDFSLGFVPLETLAETFLRDHNYPRSQLTGLVEPLLFPLRASTPGDHARSWWSEKTDPWRFQPLAWNPEWGQCHKRYVPWKHSDKMGWANILHNSYLQLGFCCVLK